MEATGEANARFEELPQPEVGDGILTRLTGAVRFTNGFSTAPVNLLPRIANCYVVADRSNAQKLAAEYPHCWFLVTDGVSYHGQAVSGGKKTGAGPLALKRELRELSQLEIVKQDEVKAAQASFVDLELAILATCTGCRAPSGRSAGRRERTARDGP